MPRSLPNRCAPDSIREFRAASQQRFRDAVSLVEKERRTAAIYLWGYCVEMVLKAAYFRLIGYAEDQPITRPDLTGAARSASAVGVVWPNPNQLHDLSLWGQLLVFRRTHTATAYPIRFGSRVLSQSLLVQRVWRETLRYHKNVAYEYEVQKVREAAEWFLSQYHDL